jgi:hypothetical protein
MNDFHFNKNFKIFTTLFVLLTLILSFVTCQKYQSLEYYFRMICIPSLMVLYFLTSEQKNKLYLFSLACATVSNVFFLSNESLFLKYGLIAFLIYRIITLLIVIKNSTKLTFFSVAIGSIFFLFPLLTFIVLIEESVGQSFFVGLINILLVSFLGGMSLTNYLMENNFKHISLLTSTLLYTFLVLIFVIQKFYVFVRVFDPMGIIVLMAAHYFFCVYLLLAENQKWLK